MNPFLWIFGSPPKGYHPGLETFWPILVESALVSVALGLIGCWLVVRGMSLLGDALAHSVLPGIVIGFLLGKSLQSAWILIGATVFGMGAAVLVQAVRDNSRVKEDASLGIVFTTLFAIGVVMINLFAGQTDLDPGCVLYGQVEYFVQTPQKIWPMACILVGVVLLTVIFFRHLLVSTFDPLLARSMGIPATLVHYAIMAVLSLTTVASFEAVGAILAVALLITPGATARLWTDRMPRMLLLATVHAMLASVIGYWMSHPAIFDTSASGAISSAGFGLFLISWLVAPNKGLISQARVRSRLRKSMAEENLIKTVHELLSPAEPTGTAAADPVATIDPATAGVSADAVRDRMHLSGEPFHTALRGVIGRGWATSRGGQINLTPAGHQRAVLLASAHELWEQYLRQEVGLADDHLHDPAEWIEHYLDEQRIAELRASLRPNAM